MGKHALLTGLTGQDGSYLAELLLEKGYEVYGVVRRSSADESRFWRIEHILDKLHLIEGDLTDQSSLIAAVAESRPDEVYSLGAQSFVATSWKQPEYTLNVTGLGTLRLLEAVKLVKKDAKVYIAGSSEQFGKVREIPQKETTQFYPRSPYGIAKVMSYWTAVNYRESYDMFVSVGILFNHESKKRGLEFVTRKIANGVARLRRGDRVHPIRLGNLDAKRDWGFAGDYVRAMYLMLQQDTPDDFVVATGQAHSVREFVEESFRVAFGGRVAWHGEAEGECGYVVAPREHLLGVTVDSKFYRPAEVDHLLGDASKAKEILGWEPKVSFKELVERMTKADLARRGYE